MYGNYASFYPQGQPMPSQPQMQSMQPLPNPVQQQPVQQFTPNQTSGNGMLWVNGDVGAKSFLVAANSSVLLFDSESPHFYIKSADASGMPLPIRKFKYDELTIDSVQSAQQTEQNAEQLTALKSDLQSQIDDLKSLVDKLQNQMKDTESQKGSDLIG